MLGRLLAPVMTPVNEQHAHVDALAAINREAVGRHVAVAYVEQGGTGKAAHPPAAQDVQLEVIKRPKAYGPKRRFVLLPRC